MFGNTKVLKWSSRRDFTLSHQLPEGIKCPSSHSLNLTLSARWLLADCRPLMSSIKAHKSKHLSSVTYIPPHFSLLLASDKCLFPGTSDPCLCNTDKFNTWEGQSQRGEFVLTSAPLGCHSKKCWFSFFFWEPVASFCSQASFQKLLSLCNDHQLTHSLQNTLQLLCERESVSCLSLLEGIAPSHPSCLLSAMWLLISCQCMLAFRLMAWCCTA